MALLQSPILWIAVTLVITLAVASTMGLFGGNKMPVDGKVGKQDASFSPAPHQAPNTVSIDCPDYWRIRGHGPRRGDAALCQRRQPDPRLPQRSQARRSHKGHQSTCRHLFPLLQKPSLTASSLFTGRRQEPLEAAIPLHHRRCLRSLVRRLGRCRRDDLERRPRARHCLVHRRRRGAPALCRDGRGLDAPPDGH